MNADSPANPRSRADAGCVVVITGSTRGIGFGLADSFLAKGCAVVVNGRSRAGVDRAVAALRSRYPDGGILGVPGDVAVADDVQALWDAAQAHFGYVHIWINNAGLETARMPLWEIPPASIAEVVGANLTGTLYGCRVALRGMTVQGSGHIYNMEGFGSDGRIAPGLTTYASTKSAVTYLTKALLEETKDLPVKVSSINPGMVLTDMLRESISPERADNAKRIFNILADTVETVTPWLAERILANDSRGAHIVWLTTPKMIGRFLMARVRKRDLFGDDEASPPSPAHG